MVGRGFLAFHYLPSQAQFGQPFCDTSAQRSVNQCAQELRQLGVFTSNQGQVDALTWEQIRRRSRQYFSQICEYGTAPLGNFRPVELIRSEAISVPIGDSTSASAEATIGRSAGRRSQSKLSTLSLTPRSTTSVAKDTTVRLRYKLDAFRFLERQGNFPIPVQFSHSLSTAHSQYD